MHVIMQDWLNTNPICTGTVHDPSSDKGPCWCTPCCSRTILWGTTLPQKTGTCCPVIYHTKKIKCFDTKYPPRLSLLLDCSEKHCLKVQCMSVTINALPVHCILSSWFYQANLPDLRELPIAINMLCTHVLSSCQNNAGNSEAFGNNRKQWE